MQAGAAAFADRIESGDAGVAQYVSFDSAADKVCRRNDRDKIVRHIDTGFQTLGKNVGEAAAESLFAVVANIKINTLFSGTFHFGVDGAGDHVARSKALHRMVFVHEFHRFRIGTGTAFENCAFAAQRFRDEKRTDGRMIEHRRVELDELHIGDFCSGPVAHCHAGTTGDIRVAGIKINLSSSAAGDGGGGSESGENLSGFGIENVGAETAVGAGDGKPCAYNEIDGDMVFKNGDVGAVFHAFNHYPFQFGSGDVAGVKHAALVVSAFAAEVEVVRIVGVAEFAAGGEFCTESDDFADRFGAGFNDSADSIFVAHSGTGSEGILNMFFKCIIVIHHAGNPALSTAAVAFVDGAFGEYGDTAAALCQMPRGGKPRKTAADNDMVKMFNFTELHDF